MAVSDTGQYAARHLQLSIAAIVAGLAALAAALHTVTPLNHDEAYFIEGAGRLLSGGRFGQEIADINPPMVWWMSAVPVWFARQIGARVELAAAIFTALLAALSLLMVDRQIAHDNALRASRRALMTIAAILLLFAPGYDFGQREHWMLLLTLPYVVARSRRADGAKLSTIAGIIVGFAACLGFCLKPYLLLVPIGLEIWLLARMRRPSPSICAETIAMAATGLLYLGLTPVYAPNFLQREVPNALLGLWSYNSTLPEVLSAAGVALAPAAALALLGIVTRAPGERIPTLARGLAVAGAASLVAALLQMKPWSYHLLPSVVLFDLAAVLLLITGAARAGKQTIRRGAFAVLFVMGFLPSLTEALLTFEAGGSPSRADRLAAVFRAHPGPNGSVFGFITSPRDVFPAIVAARTKWAAPFCCQFLIAAAVRADEAPADKRAALKAAGLAQAEQALAAARAYAPGVIVIATGDRMLGFNNRKFDYLEWLGTHTNFADMLRRYREIEPIGPFRVFVRL